MNHLKWMGHSATIFDIQRNLRNDPQSCEVTLVAKGHSVRAHRFVLSSCSDLLRNLLVDVPMGQEATIVVPDIRGSLLEAVLAFIYMGETSLTSTNLSEFLEAINTLGIKSAISFECNNAALTSAVAATSAEPVKTLTGIHIAQEELMVEQENIGVEKLETQNVITEQQATTTRELEFLDVYSDPQPKITYSIEHLPGTNMANEFILTENSGTFTLTQNAKLEASSDSEKICELEEDTEDGQIIEEYSSSGDPMVEMAESTATTSVPTTSSVAISSATVATGPTQPVIQIKQKIKAIKLKTPTMSQPSEPMQKSMELKLDDAADPIAVLKSSDSSYESQCQDTALSLAVQAVLNEGMSLQKAAQTYEIAKTVLWRRVRKHPNSMKTARENPVLTLAYERLKGGDSLKNISRELDIPMSTLHRHKVRLAQQGRLPDYVTFKKRDMNSKIELKDKLIKAVHACVHEGMSQNHAANLFDIPKSTLWRHLQKRIAEAELAGLKPGDIKEEVILS